MFKKALVATDLGEPSEQFITCKAGLRSLGVEELVLGLCIRLHEVGGVKIDMEELLRPELERHRKTLEQLGFKVDVDILMDEPGVAVNRLAETKDCDLVVIGSRVHSLAGEVFLGGVAGDVLHSCRKPLLVVRVPIHTDSPKDCPLHALETVLFSTDFSENAEHAFASVSKLVEDGRKTVVLMHVQDRTRLERYLEDRLQEFNAVDQDRLGRMKEHLLAKGAGDVRIELSYGLPVKDILERTQRGDISLVVMGSQGRGYISELFLGSVSHNVARNAKAPVLLIPALR